MDWPVEQVMAFQLALEWEGLMRALITVLVWTAWLGALAVALGSVMEASCRAVRPRRFWCPSAGRDVDVQLEEEGIPGFRQTLRVMACSAFEPASTIACRRACKDATRRHPGWVSPVRVWDSASLTRPDTPPSARM